MPIDYAGQTRQQPPHHRRSHSNLKPFHTATCLILGKDIRTLIVMASTDSKLVSTTGKIKVEFITDRDPALGLPNTEIRVDDLSGVPGLLPHWKGELLKRKKEISETMNISFAKKATRLFSNTTLPTVNGSELLSIIDPNLKSNNSTKALNSKPNDCNERTHLVAYVLKRSVSRGREISLLQMRSLLLHAFLANSFEERTLPSLLTLYQIYNSYMEQLGARNENAVNEALKGKFPKEIEKKIHLNKKMVMVYKIYVGRRVPKILPQIKQLHVDNNELKNFDTSQENAEEKKNLMLRSAYFAVGIMRCFPLLRKEAMDIADLVSKLDDSHPLGSFLKGHIIAASGELKFDLERAGYKPKGIKESMISDIKSALENYGQSLSLIQGSRYDGLNYNILAEYISFIIFVCRFIPAPREWKKSNLEKARNTLSTAQSKNLPKLVKMQNNVESLMGTI
ncbi:MAG: hypothetical protein HQM13_07255 [SAR324 cluster bacterium]|nr:hypothetical protein [SAR324 cluster bacterium]